MNRMPVMDIQAKIESKKPYLIPESEYKLHVGLTRKSIRSSSSNGKQQPQRQDGKIYAPMFPKPQYESWWMILGDANRDELLAMKRISMRNGPNETLTNKSNSVLTFDTPERLGKQQYTLYLISDGYQGLDQQVDIDFETRIE